MKIKKLTAEEIVEIVKQLPAEERKKLKEHLMNMPDDLSEFEKFVAEPHCPICGSSLVQPIGRRKNDKMKFVCNDCGYSFSIAKIMPLKNKKISSSFAKHKKVIIIFCILISIIGTGCLAGKIAYREKKRRDRAIRDGYTPEGIELANWKYTTLTYEERNAISSTLVSYKNALEIETKGQKALAKLPEDKRNEELERIRIAKENMAKMDEIYGDNKHYQYWKQLVLTADDEWRDEDGHR